MTVFDTDNAVEIIDYISKGRAESYADLSSEDVWFNLRIDFFKFTEHGSSVYHNQNKLESGDDYISALQKLATKRIRSSPSDITVS